MVELRCEAGHTGRVKGVHMVQQLSELLTPTGIAMASVWTAVVAFTLAVAGTRRVSKHRR